MSPDGKKKKDIIMQEGFYISTPSGRSMLPLLRPLTDSVVIRSAECGIKRRDIVLYETPDGRHILHRIVRVTKSGYVMRGDNCMANEYGIKAEDIIGKMTSFYRADKEISLNSFSLRIYGFLWCLIYPLRRAVNKIKRIFR